MKKHYFSLLFLFFFSVASAQIVNIPDANFKAKLLSASSSNQVASIQIPSINGTVTSFNSIDTNSDGEIQVSEAILIKYLDVSDTSIVNLEGVLSFTNLYVLNCTNNLISNLNVAGLNNLQSLLCGYNLISNINVDSLINLKEIHCFNNLLFNLNLNGLINLQYLAFQNNQLSSLNLSGLINLQYLAFQNNQMTSLNLNGLTNLQNLNCSSNQLTSLNVSGLTNLQQLQCDYNQLTSLNVDGLTNLQQLDCNGNQLTSLNVSGLTNLQYLFCNSNQLTNLNFVGLTNLQQLDCSNNQLLSINVSGLSNLQFFGCSNNQLASLDLQGLTNLEYIECYENNLSSINAQGLTSLLEIESSNNQLTSLNLQGSINLIRLVCDHSLFTTLDLQGLINLQYLNCSYNQLTSLNIKNGANFNELYFNGNPNIQFICVDEQELDDVQSLLLLYGITTCQVNSYCSFTPGGTFYTINGINKIDTDNNGCDASDGFYSNLKYSITDGVNSGSLISNASGNYSIPVQAGTHTITPQLENPSYFTISPTNATVTFPATASPFTQDFCIVPNGVRHDLEVVIIPLAPARPGFNATYKIKYKNKGTVSENATLVFDFNDDVLDYVSSTLAPTSTGIGLLSWNIGTIIPFQSGEFVVTLNVNSPMETPAVNAGDILSYTATINGLNTDETQLDNTFPLRQIVVNSYDPNDKTCLEGATINPTMIGDYVHYQIRFENTGTFPAQNVVVKDMIDTTKFDISTLQITDTSHSCVTRVTNPNKVEFIFENINLPFDDATNDGYVVFKIKTKPTLTVGSTISNSANIYFDYNFPIVTNTSTSTFQALSNNTFNLDNYISLSPNPAKDILNINVQDEVNIKSIAIYNMLGQLVQITTSSINSINISDLKAGNYVIKLYIEKGEISRKFIKE
ncbi:T9SS type A sorting domain-containing protein [Flavobacterium sp.]|uniref:DUF7619 domain-containing protein n=1 Tax=Flavobacterium sp. TaxID=239 RepID=UPI002627FFAB|nr:T9SS type A sorting domain-containing protein [Flavobacterium sp.]